MKFFKKKPDDPLKERLNDLQAEIAQIDARIRKLKEKGVNQNEVPSNQDKPKPNIPEDLTGQFKPIYNKQKINQPNTPVTAEHINEFGVQKIDLLEKLNRHINLTQDQDEKAKLAQRLIMSNLQGRPVLRRERRIQRNRFIIFTIIIAIFLFGILALIFK